MFLCRYLFLVSWDHEQNKNKMSGCESCTRWLARCEGREGERLPEHKSRRMKLSLSDHKFFQDQHYWWGASGYQGMRDTRLQGAWGHKRYEGMRKVKTRFLSPHHFKVQKVQTISITTCSVDLSPPPPSRTTTPSILTEWQIGISQTPPRIQNFGAKNPKPAITITLISHQKYSQQVLVNYMDKEVQIT